MSVVAQAGGWIVSVAIIPHAVKTIERTPLPASRNPSTDTGGGVVVSETPAASAEYARNPAAPPSR
jgi:hypothetical protein